MKTVKVVGTIGPSLMDKMDEASPLLDVVRINFSHGDHKSHKKEIKLVRESDKTLPIMLDTAGPEVRVQKEFNLENDMHISEISVQPKTKLKTGDHLLFDDGLFEATVKNEKIHCEHEGVVRKGAKLIVTNRDLGLPTISKRDFKDIEFGLKEGIDMIALSFVRHGNDIIKLNKLLDKKDLLDIWVIPKIEHSWALNNLEDIIKLSDGVMIARGDLALYTPFQKVPLVQKKIIEMSLNLRRPSIVATQMLSSMVYNITPTRAEVSDVVNAILDGCDAVMLSNETTVGKHPIKSLKVMQKIIQETGRLPSPKVKPIDIKDEMARSAGRIAESMNASIFTKTQRGRTPRRIAKFRPNAPIYTIETKKSRLRNLRLIWGVEIGKPNSGCVVEVEHLTEAPSIKVKYLGKILARGTGYGSGKVVGTVGKEIKVINNNDKFGRAKAIIYLGEENQVTFQKILISKIPMIVTLDKVKTGEKVLVDIDLGTVLKL
ncbi:MAG: pyruvate kinase [Candidatus Altiarchaeota archaeon]|nr:pyruvate kinase [Candidatus Altiarchaeota archaeon]